MKSSVYVLMIVFALLLLSFAGCGDSNYLSWLGDDGTADACQRQIDLDLDSGNYDAVIDSNCSDHMDIAAAYFGKAGFDITQVVIAMIDSNEAGAKPFSIYTSDLVANVTSESLRYLELANYHYNQVTLANGYDPNLVRDAEFYSVALVNSVSTFSVIKAALDPDGDGDISDCDINNNGNSDELDALSCSLLLAGGSLDCSSLSVVEDTDSYPSLSFVGYSTLYNGIEVTIANVIANAACPATYRNLAYDNGVGHSIAASSSDICVDASYPLAEWPCPYEDVNSAPTGMLEVFNDAIVDSANLLVTLGYDNTSEVYLAINSVAEEACGAGSDCTETELSNYLQCQLSDTPPVGITCP